MSRSGRIDVAVRDDGYYAVTCANGHPHVYCVPQPLFEVLFEIAVSAAVDGYYRESVGSWAASLERFQEFFFRAAAVAMGVPDDEVAKAWKDMSNASERQSGAYIAAYLALFRRAPSMLTSREREFRNSVVHKGEIPEEAEALDFGERIKTLICGDYKNLASMYSEPLRVARLKRQRSVEQRVPPTISPVHWMPISAIYRAATDMDCSGVAALVQCARSRRALKGAG